MRSLKENKYFIPVFSRLVKFLGICCIAVLLQACANKTFDNEKDLWAYLKEASNGYLQHKDINGVRFSLLYKPTDLLVKQELGNSRDKENIKTLRKKYGKYMYFNLSMSKNNRELLSTAPKNRNEFGAMVNQLAFGMNNKVHLFTQKKDTIPLADYIYPRMYGMSRSTDMLFVFPRNNNALTGQYLNFTIEDLGLNTGEVKFKIETRRIKNELKLSI